MRNKSAPLFVYGSLLFDEFVEALVHERPDSRAATLRGFVRQSLYVPEEKAHYPVLINAPECMIHGKLLVGLSDEALTVLDFFESDADYEQRSVTVQTGNAQASAIAYVYIGNDVLPIDWDPERFAQEELEHCIRVVAPHVRNTFYEQHE